MHSWTMSTVYGSGRALFIDCELATGYLEYIKVYCAITCFTSTSKSSQCLMLYSPPWACSKRAEDCMSQCHNHCQWIFLQNFQFVEVQFSINEDVSIEMLRNYLTCNCHWQSTLQSCFVEVKTLILDNCWVTCHGIREDLH